MDDRQAQSGGEERRGFGAGAPTPSALERRVAELERLVEERLGLLADPLDSVLFAELTNGDGQWKEKIVAGGSLVDYGTPGTDGRNCASASDPSKPVRMAEAQGVLIEVTDGDDSRYVLVPNGDFLVYLTQNGGANGDDGTTTTAAFPTYTYDVFLDAAKTIQIASAASVLFHRPLKIAVTAAAHGIARFDGEDVILITADEYFDRDECS
jgi:hypothetical protein